MDEGLDGPFGAVDRFAIELGVDADDPRRVEAGILFELRYNLNAGHSFLPEDKLASATAQLLNVDNATVRESIDRLLDHQRLYRDTLANIQVLYLPELFSAENYCTRRLLEFADSIYKAPVRLEHKLQTAARQAATDKIFQ
jgi:exodeoxyribonuclease V alpha subunit